MTLLEASRYVVFIALLLLATRHDILSHRIPNALTIGGAVAGVLSAALVAGVDGLLLSIGGLMIGLLGLLPFHLRKAMGAGDVKLMAMVGSFLGPAGAVLAVGFTLVTGALLAIGLVLANRLAPRDRLAALLTTEGDTGPPDGTRSSILRNRFPYAAAILVGSLVALAVSGVLAPLFASIGLAGSGGG